jgi:hypothetical protein
MKTSMDINELATALNEASKQIGAAVKGKENPFFKAKYADLGSVIMTFKEPVLDAGLSYVQLPITNGAAIGVVTRLMHTSGQWLEEEYTVTPSKPDPQAAGAALTYCRRYALAALFGVPTADSDAEAAMYRGKVELPEGVTGGIEGAEDIKQLADLFKVAWNEYPDHRAALTAVKDSRKKELNDDSAGE